MVWEAPDNLNPYTEDLTCLILTLAGRLRPIWLDNPPITPRRSTLERRNLLL